MNEDSNSRSAKSRVQMWANFYPAANQSGAGSYVDSILRYMQAQSDLEVEVHLLRPADAGTAKLTDDLERRTYVWPEGYREGAAASLFQFVYAQTSRTGTGWLKQLFRWMTPQRIRNQFHRLRTGLKTAATQEAGTDALREFAPEDRELIARVLRDSSPDCVIANYAWMADLLQLAATNPQCFRVILTHDVLHERSRDMRNLMQGSGELDWTAEREANHLKSANLIVAIQEADADVFRKICPDIPVIVTPYATATVSLPAASKSGQCLFVGSASDHNIQGIRWFADQVWPLVLKRAPSAQLKIAGNVGSKFRSADQSIEVLGIVDDLSNHYQNSNVCVIPLQFGSGLKIKLIDALAHGRACVSTSVGLQGVDFLQDQGVLRADQADEFATAVVRLIEDPALRDQQQRLAHQSIERWFSAAACYGEFVQAIRGAASRSRRSSSGANLK